MTIQLYADTAAPADRRKYLFGPITDFVLLGGGALLILPLLLLVPKGYEGMVAATMLIVSHLINHPHFAHSYQIFYRNFGRKVRGDGYDRNLQTRYIFAGLVVPALMVGFFVYGAVTENARLLGQAANMMAFFVGWHYVKQGYGILMVDAVLKKQFFKDRDKKVFLVNGYVVWLLAWMMVNAQLAGHKLWGLDYYTFALPAWLINLGIAAAALSTAATALVLVDRWRKNGGSLPYNGVVAYLVSLYAWMLFVRINPLWLLVVPALHSLQYLAVVWRYQTNIEMDRMGADREPELKLLNLLGPMWRLRVVAFILAGGFLGAIGFWIAPLVMNAMIPYNKEIFGSALFLFMAWIFINVHHYFLDNVMWRRGNPDVSKYLFR